MMDGPGPSWQLEGCLHAMTVDDHDFGAGPHRAQSVAESASAPPRRSPARITACQAEAAECKPHPSLRLAPENPSTARTCAGTALSSFEPERLGLRLGEGTIIVT